MLSVSKRLAAAVAAPALALTGCYVVPLAPDGTPIYPYAHTAPPYTVVPYPAARPYVAGPPPCTHARSATSRARRTPHAALMRRRGMPCPRFGAALMLRERRTTGRCTWAAVAVMGGAAREVVG